MKRFALAFAGWAIFAVTQGPEGFGKAPVTKDNYATFAECDKVEDSPEVRAILNTELASAVPAGNTLYFYCQRL